MLELQRLTVILTDEIANPRLRKSDPGADLRTQRPFQFMRG